MPDEAEVLTNLAAATRLRKLLTQPVQDEPPLSPRLVPTPDAHGTPADEEHR